MSLYLPPPVRPIAWVAGASWPDGDEDKMWAVSRAWEQASKDLAAQVPGIESAKTAAMAAFPAGDAADQIGKLFDVFLQGDQSLATLAESFKTIGDSTFDVGTELQSAKINIIVSLCILLVEIAWAWLFPPTAPAVEAAAIGTTRSIVKFIADALQNALERAWAKLGFATRGELNGASRYWFKHILSADTWKGMKGQTWKYKAKTILPTAKGMGVYTLKFGEGALWAPVTNAIVQGAQIADGKRHGFNWKEFGASWAASALSTIPSRELGRYMGFGIGNLDKKFGGAITNMPFRSGMFLQGATIGATAGVFGNIFGNIGAGAVTGDIAGAFAGPEGWVGSAARGGMVGGMRGLGTKTTTNTEGDPRFNLWMNAKAPWAPPKTPPTNNPLTPRPVPGQTESTSTTHSGTTTNTGGNHQQGGGFRDPSDPNYMTPSRPAPAPPTQAAGAGGGGNHSGSAGFGGQHQWTSGGHGGGFRDPSDPNYMTPSRPAPAPPVNGGHGGGGFRDPSDPNYMVPSRPAPAPPVNGGHSGGGFRDPSDPNYMTPSRPAPAPPVTSGQGGGGFRDPSDPNYMTPSRPAPQPPVNGGQGGGGFRSPSDPNYLTPSRPAPAPPVGGGDGSAPHPVGSSANAAPGSRPAPSINAAPTGNSNNPPNFSRPFTQPGASVGGPVSSSSAPIHAAPVGNSTEHPSGPPNFSRPFTQPGPPSAPVPNSSTGGQVGGGFRDPSDPNYMTPSRPAPAPPVNGGQGGFRDPSDPNYLTPSRPAPAPPVNGGQGGGGFRDPSDPNYMIPSRPAPPPPVDGGQGGGGFRDPSDPNYMTPSRPAPAPPPPSDPAEPQDPGRPLGPGKDYRAKSRPKKVPEIGPMPAHYDAPDAPGEQAWLEAAEPPPVPRAAATDSPGGDDPGGGDPNVDKPFQM
ncbi:WXG100-like domain-containing protein [Nocardia violaceofusca]|uniref:WXG100-like domain-containing protein n=1 Tax=Nocardia violaceofusca TaxID=941182 RepID=UPI0007A4ED8C|nr:hypothetical protein [Nocardia violaceofusca]